MLLYCFRPCSNKYNQRYSLGFINPRYSRPYNNLYNRQFRYRGLLTYAIILFQALQQQVQPAVQSHVHQPTLQQALQQPVQQTVQIQGATNLCYYIVSGPSATSTTSCTVSCSSTNVTAGPTTTCTTDSSDTGATNLCYYIVSGPAATSTTSRTVSGSSTQVTAGPSTTCTTDSLDTGSYLLMLLYCFRPCSNKSNKPYSLRFINLRYSRPYNNLYNRQFRYRELLTYAIILFQALQQQVQPAVQSQVHQPTLQQALQQPVQQTV